MFKNILSYKGRIRRLEFVANLLFYMFANTTILAIIGDSSEKNAPALIFLSIPFTIFLLIQGAKRSHDIGNSGFYQIIPFYIFWLIFVDSDYGLNKYGGNPKGIGNHDDIDDIGLQMETP